MAFSSEAGTGSFEEDASKQGLGHEAAPGLKREFEMSETQQNAAPPEAPVNPLLRPWQTPFETPPFAEISPEHFLPAFEQAFADHSAEVAAITHDPSAPDFANTITA